MDNTAQRQPTQEEIEQATRAWQRDAFQRAQKHLAQKGIMPDKVFDKESRFMAPLCAVWKMQSKQGKKYWVISGNLPTDHVEISAAKDARDALRYFSFQWQLKADQVMSQGAHDKTQVDFANLLVNRAHNIYEMHSNDQLWLNEPS